MRTVRVLVIAALAGAGSSRASTSEAWRQHDAEVKRACIAASGLQRARIAPDKATFSDVVPIDLRIVEGYNKHSVIDVRLCAFDRPTRKLTTTEATGRLGVNR